VFGSAAISRRDDPSCHHRDMTSPVRKMPWWKNPRVALRLGVAWGIGAVGAWVQAATFDKSTASVTIAIVASLLSAGYFGFAALLRRLGAASPSGQRRA
jgi:hypothetical protein